MSWTKKATQESEVLLSAKCLSNEKRAYFMMYLLMLVIYSAHYYTEAY
ncbi:hypothetical protein [Vibrio vulnificus]|nr:hypothetical protein [Vibrio vulnificus]